ncbi:MAG: GAF domain-containing protein [Acidobacteriota bacterium]
MSSRYDQAQQEISALLEGIDDAVAIMATVASVIHSHVPQASWTGFYRVVAPGKLRVGPYQGPVGCLEIDFEKGVCGAAAREQKTQVVADVHQFPGHIACDPDSRSEIVVPIHDHQGELIAVLDLDSHQPAAFDEHDRNGLEAIARQLRPLLT